MGLIARAVEQLGIPTVTLAALRKPAQMVRPPRALFTGNRNAEIVGPPGERAAQRATLRAALGLLVSAEEPGSLTEQAH